MYSENHGIKLFYVKIDTIKTIIAFLIVINYCWIVSNGYFEKYDLKYRKLRLISTYLSIQAYDKLWLFSAMNRDSCVCNIKFLTIYIAAAGFSCEFLKMADNLSSETVPENAQDLTIFVQNLLEQMVRTF